MLSFFFCESVSVWVSECERERLVKWNYTLRQKRSHHMTRTDKRTTCKAQKNALEMERSIQSILEKARNPVREADGEKTRRCSEDSRDNSTILFQLSSITSAGASSVHFPLHWSKWEHRRHISFPYLDKAVLQVWGGHMEVTAVWVWPQLPLHRGPLCGHHRWWRGEGVSVSPPPCCLTGWTCGTASVSGAKSFTKDWGSIKWSNIHVES